MSTVKLQGKYEHREYQDPLILKIRDLLPAGHAKSNI